MSRLTCLLAAAALVLSAPVLAQTVPWPLNDTGLNVCSEGGTGRAITDCANSGQDAAVGRDVTTAASTDGVAGFSYLRVCNNGLRAGEGDCPAVPVAGAAANQWGCTLDTVTGLLWEVKRNDGGPRDRQRAHTNLPPGDPGHGGPTDAASVLQQLNAEALCGHTDWALPTRQQLLSVLHYGIAHPGPTIDTAYFDGTQNWLYWTSVSPAGDPSRAMIVDHSEGSVHTAPRSLFLPLRAVRGGQPAPQARFVPLPENEGEVRDLATGLIWARCPYGQFWFAGACSGVPFSSDWSTAISFARLLTGGWRMPNIKELNSIVDESLTGNRLDPVAFPGAAAEWNWSSSTYVGDKDYAWGVDLDSGRTAIISKRNWDGRRQFRIVRDDPNAGQP